MAYIKKEPIVEFITKGLNNPDKTKAYGYDAIAILTEIEYAPEADVVSAKAYEQVKWERDTAIEQLQSYGVGFGENKELAEVKHAFRTLNVGHRSFCSNCEGLAVCEKYCSLCGAKMDGGKKG